MKKKTDRLLKVFYTHQESNYFDQINIDEKKLFGKKRWMELLKKNSALSLQGQILLFEEELKKFHGKENQTDDITMIGFTCKN